MDTKRLAAAGKAGADHLAIVDLNPNLAIQEMVRAYQECQVVRAQERTKRRRIKADETIALAEIAAKRDLFMQYLTLSFDERSANFSALFERVDAALEKGELQMLAILTNDIVDLAKSSPFKDLATIEATRQAIKNPEHDWEV